MTRCAAQRLGCGITVALCLASFATEAGAQATSAAPPADRQINVFRYVLGIDVPQSPALVALDAAPEMILLGSSHKPLSASISTAFDGSDRIVTAFAVDASPYFLLGGGRRSLDSYRSMSLLGRVRRVMTKAMISVGVSDTAIAGQAGTPRSSAATRPRYGFAVRLTFHDPHDTIGPTNLPEQLASAFEQAQVTMPDAARRDLHGLGVDLDPLYAAGRDAVRARGGDAQVSAGWGVSAPFGRPFRGTAKPDDASSVERTHHVFWLAAQYTVDARHDIIANVQHRDSFGDQARVWIGTAWRRKGTRVDIQGGLVYDAEARRLYPSLSGDLRVARRFAVVATLRSRPPAWDLDGPTSLGIAIQGRWFFASDRR